MRSKKDNEAVQLDRNTTWLGAWIGKTPIKELRRVFKIGIMGYSKRRARKLAKEANAARLELVKQSIK